LVYIGFLATVASAAAAAAVTVVSDWSEAVCFTAQPVVMLLVVRGF